MSDEKKDLRSVEPGNIPPVPQNLWDKYTERLTDYKEKRKQIHSFIKNNLKKDIDFGKSDRQSGKDTLLKSGAEKIADLIESKIKIYPDYDSWNMMGKGRCVYYVGYLIDQTLLSMIIKYLLQVGIEHEQKVVKLFAWGEGRGAYAIDEKCYGVSQGKLAGQPLKGSENRAVKMAQKRCKVDVIIGTLGLDFTQDEEYGNNGKLKDDNPDKQPGLVSMKNLADENKALFQDIMVILNSKEQGHMIWNNKEKSEFFKKASGVTRDINKLRDLHNQIKETTMLRCKYIIENKKGNKE